MLIKRNMLIYFRDRRNVFYSLFSVLIMIGIYLLFLGQGMEMVLRNALGLDASFNTGAVMTGIVLAGMVASTSVTSGMIGIYRFVGDKETAAKDFFTSPVSRQKILFGYVAGEACIGLIMTGAMLAVALAYLMINGGLVLGIEQVGKLALTIALTALCANSLVFLLAAAAKTREAFSGLISLVSAFIGFLMGVFIPIGSLPDGVAWVLRFFPLSHAASMLRQVIADEPLNYLFTSLDVPQQYLDGVRLHFGIVFEYGDFVSSFWFSAAVLAVTAVVLYGISLAVVVKKKVIV